MSIKFIKLSSLLFIINSVWSIQSVAQTEVALSYNSILVDNDIGISINRNINRTYFGVGLKFLINSDQFYDSSDPIRNGMIANSFGEHFGFFMNTAYRFKLPKENLRPYIGFDIFYTKAHLKPDFSKFTAIQYSISMGLHYLISKQNFVFTQFGISFTDLINLDQRIIIDGSWSFGRIFRVGVGHSLKN